MSHAQKAVEVLKQKVGEAVLAVEIFREQTTIVLERTAIVQACQLLRDDPQLRFNFLAALTAVDYWPEQPRMVVVYQLYSVQNKVFLGLKVPLQSESLEVDSIESVFPNANWHEREVYDMFGVTFNGHSDLRRILMPYGWEGHPLRKDYPLGYEEVQFSFNFDEIDRRKPYAEE